MDFTPVHVAFLVILGVAGVWQTVRKYQREKRAWNEGRCPHCSAGHWRDLFDTSPRDGAYKCDCCGALLFLYTFKPK